MSTDTADLDSDIEQSKDLNTHQHQNSDINIKKIRLKNGLGSMQKRKQEAILRTARYKVHNNPEKYYYSKLLLYYPWTNEEEVLMDSTLIKNPILQNNISYTLMHNTSMMIVNYLIYHLKM